MNSRADLTMEQAPIAEIRERLTDDLLAFLDGELVAFEPHKHLPRLNLLAELFSLSEAETKVVSVLWLSCFSSKLQRCFTRLMQREYLSLITITQLLKLNAKYYLGDSSALTKWALLNEQFMADGGYRITLDPVILNWLEGDELYDPWVANYIRPTQHLYRVEPEMLNPYAEKVKQSIIAQKPIDIYVIANDCIQAENFSAELMATLGFALASFEQPVVTNELTDTSLRIARFCYLTSKVPYYSENQSMARLSWNSTRFPIQIFYCANQQVMVNLRSSETHNREVCVIELAPLNRLEITELWQNCLPESLAWQAIERERLYHRPHISASDILRVAQQAPKNIDQVNQILNRQVDNDLHGLAQKINSDFQRDDLVVTDAISLRIDEIIFEARARNELWSKPEVARMFPHGRGLMALFSGPPGVGKTMAAQVIANQLGLNLLRVDLSTLVSKWVGETIENVQKVLSAKVSQQSVIFFDEADALFGRRIDDVKDANDRFLNMDSGHLMVALENFDGIVLMATNLVGNIDPAFIRRIRHTIEFEKPNHQARIAIWKKCTYSLFENAETLYSDQDFNCLAKLEGTGAQIKNACLSSLLQGQQLAKPVTARLLAQMLCRELAKDGRGMSEEHLSRLLAEGGL
ncbi:MAG: ATP-binding protein [Gammaproteobacteria bacterium]|nr:ATP-binding protein [Gammaproteobacteria bacterium]